ncbi:glycosyltransferase [Futiania mangrovi]|uniref:Glycosyltransferase family 2 protein n=1 Tax=Futiania mangrovi TaxID=2959716 RepID=A0A9J6P9K1_9PROT|nr:glycosyltransferase family 2 protein [Futiania mangrovii]MCP1335549.1 glycosyltransferase family 2 protein [Futiania mangrovii]
MAANLLFASIVAVSGLTFVLSAFFLLRQLFLTFHVLRNPRPSVYRAAALSHWPTVTVIVPCHNEEQVVGNCIERLTRLDYPEGRLEIVVINDRSQDRTGEIADAWARRDPRIRVVHRGDDARPGKPAALRDVIPTVESEAIVFFDADYLPFPGIVKQLVAPLIDPQVGATMGRVVPCNTNASLLTRLIDLERRAGYGIDQHGRSMLGLLPQFGGTVGAVRRSALEEIGGWQAEALAEDTDLTYRLFIAGYTVEYLNHATCYEEAPETWEVRFRQVRRWAYGHNQCFARHVMRVLKAPGRPLWKRLDAALVLMFYLLPPLALASLACGLVYPLLFAYPPVNLTVLSAMSFFIGFGNFAPYFQIMAAARLDGQPAAAGLVPLLFLSSTISMLAAASAVALAVYNTVTRTRQRWDKTQRYRSAAS